MKIYEFGDAGKPVIMLFPGTCCYWKTNFGHVLPNLQKYFYTAVVSYSGFDETENTTFVSELDETEKIEAYIKEKFQGRIFAAYGCSLGGSVVSLLVGRKNIHIDHAIIGSSDMDQAPKWLAKMETAMVMPLFYPFLTGKENSRMEKMFNKKMNQGDEKEADYMKKFMEVMGRDSGIDFSFISKDSVRNQFCTDLYTKSVNTFRHPVPSFMFFMPGKWVKNIWLVIRNTLPTRISANSICGTKSCSWMRMSGQTKSARHAELRSRTYKTGNQNSYHKDTV